jgi:hypothetical protein
MWAGFFIGPMGLKSCIYYSVIGLVPTGRFIWLDHAAECLFIIRQFVLLPTSQRYRAEIIQQEDHLLFGDLAATCRYENVVSE